MIIGIDASRANREEKTGIEWYAYHLVNAMKKIEISNLKFGITDFLLYTDSKLSAELSDLPEHWHEKLLGWPPGKFWTQGRLSLEMLVRPPDLLFIPSHVIPVIHPKRVVLTCHDIGFERRPELYPKAELAYHRWSMRFGVRAATHIIAVSEFTKQELMDVYKLPSEKISVIHHGYYGGAKDLNQESRIKNDPHQLPLSVRGRERGLSHDSLFIIHDSPYLLYVGRIEAKKNLTVIIDAVTLLKRAKKIPQDLGLILVGRRGYRSDVILKHLARQGDPAMQHIPWVPPETLDTLYRGARVFLFPSLYEGFGLPLLEAFSYGVPVIASDIPALREIGGNLPLFVTPSADAFADAILAILANAQTEKGKEALKAHCARFSWENAARSTLTVLRSAL